MAEHKLSYTGAEVDALLTKVKNGEVLTVEEKTKLQNIDLSTKQDKLVSGQNIKTINGQSLLGGGNIVIQPQGGSGNTQSTPEHNPFKGKIISFLGDSITTFNGWIPTEDGFNKNHAVFYPCLDIDSVEYTWWKMLLNNLEAKLGVNDSWSGSRVSNSATVNDSECGPDACMASNTRIKNLGANGTPDFILFYGGTNDAGRPVTSLGSFDSNQEYKNPDLNAITWSSFADAYRTAIQRLQYYYPTTKIVVMLPIYTGSYYSISNLDKYNEVIKEICDYFGVECLDMRACGIHYQSLGHYMQPDRLHPNRAGMVEIERYVRKKLQALYDTDGMENVTHTLTTKLKTLTTNVPYMKKVSQGKPFNATISGSNLGYINVMMNGSDVTSSCYNANTGQISIASVTGKIEIIEVEPTNYTIVTNYNNAMGRVSLSSQSGAKGEQVTVTITPNSGHAVVGVKINGSAVTVSNSVTFTTVGGINTVEVVFEDIRFTTNLTFDSAKGTATLSKTTGVKGDAITVDATPIGENQLIRIVANGVTYTESPATFNAISGINNVEVVFDIPTFRIESTHDESMGDVTISKLTGATGEDVTVVATPKVGFTVASITINGKVYAKSSVTFKTEGGLNTIDVVFEEVTETSVVFGDWIANTWINHLGVSAPFNGWYSTDYILIPTGATSVEGFFTGFNGTGTQTPYVNNKSNMVSFYDTDKQFLGGYTSRPVVPELGFPSGLSAENIVEFIPEGAVYARFCMTSENCKHITTGETRAYTTSDIQATWLFKGGIVKVDSTKGGSVLVDKTEINQEGEQVTVTITPKPGYTIESITINDVPREINNTITFNARKGINTVKVVFSLDPSKLQPVNFGTWKANTWIKQQDGTDQTLVNWVSTDFISIPSEAKGISTMLTAFRSSSATTTPIVFFDGDKSYISAFEPTQEGLGAYDLEESIPENAAYVRFCFTMENCKNVNTGVSVSLTKDKVKGNWIVD